MTAVVKRLEKLRALMHTYQLDYYISPNSDPHSNEIPPAYWSRRPWITEFTGSAGEAIIGKEHAYLSTDGRYFLQAAKQMKRHSFSLLKQSGYAPITCEWLKENAHDKTIGVDPQTITIKRAKNLAQQLDSINAQLKFVDINLIDACKEYFNEMPDIPDSKAFILEQQYSGESCLDKLSWLRNILTDHGSDYLILNVLDEICWLFNIRAGDIENTPLLISYAIIGKHESTLFTHTKKIDQKVLCHLENSQIKVLEYDQFNSSLQQLTGTLILDDQQAPISIYHQVTANAQNKIKLMQSPIVARKSCKNHIEQEGARVAHKKDSVALIKFIHWLTQNWKHGITEIEAASKLKTFRLQMPNVLDLSFETKSAFASNGAIIHYDPTPETNKTIDDSSLYLFDSGSQYLESTTDVTRTVHLGIATAKQKEHYTLVLKGHLGLGRAQFPAGTHGEHLDALARVYLWAEGLDYQHGTGHGVGSSLCVHEGPQKISKAVSNIPLQPGMIVSNEPGLYLENQYGIRIENLCLIIENSKIKDNDCDSDPFYSFETLTLMPYCKNLIDETLLTYQEKIQIINYYKEIERNVIPLLDSDEQNWLKNELDTHCFFPAAEEVREEVLAEFLPS